MESIDAHGPKSLIISESDWLSIEDWIRARGLSPYPIEKSSNQHQLQPWPFWRPFILRTQSHHSGSWARCRKRRRRSPIIFGMLFLLPFILLSLKLSGFGPLSHLDLSLLDGLVIKLGHNFCTKRKRKARLETSRIKRRKKTHDLSPFF